MTEKQQFICVNVTDYKGVFSPSAINTMHLAYVQRQIQQQKTFPSQYLQNILIKVLF
jgi:hypothetical protein